MRVFSDRPSTAQLTPPLTWGARRSCWSLWAADLRCSTLWTPQSMGFFPQRRMFARGERMGAAMCLCVFALGSRFQHPCCGGPGPAIRGLADRRKYGAPQRCFSAGVCSMTLALPDGKVVRDNGRAGLTFQPGVGLGRAYRALSGTARCRWDRRLSAKLLPDFSWALDSRSARRRRRAPSGSSCFSDGSAVQHDGPIRLAEHAG